MHAPEEVMMLLELRWLLERRDRASLRIYGTEHLANGTVLPLRVASLQHDEDCITGVGVQHALEIGDAVGLLLRRALEGGAALRRRWWSCVGVGEPGGVLAGDRMELQPKIGNTLFLARGKGGRQHARRGRDASMSPRASGNAQVTTTLRQIPHARQRGNDECGPLRPEPAAGAVVVRLT